MIKKIYLSRTKPSYSCTMVWPGRIWWWNVGSFEIKTHSIGKVIRICNQQCDIWHHIQNDLSPEANCRLMVDLKLKSNLMEPQNKYIAWNTQKMWQDAGSKYLDNQMTNNNILVHSRVLSSNLHTSFSGCNSSFQQRLCQENRLKKEKRLEAVFRLFPSRDISTSDISWTIK